MLDLRKAFNSLNHQTLLMKLRFQRTKGELSGYSFQSVLRVLSTTNPAETKPSDTDLRDVEYKIENLYSDGIMLFQ